MERYSPGIQEKLGKELLKGFVINSATHHDMAFSVIPAAF
jgi:hypothetical protein